MVNVIAMIEVAPGKRALFLDEFRRVVPTVRAEDGCIEYTPTIDVDTGNEKVESPRADVVTVVEKWESLAHLEAHLSAPHMADYRERVKNVVVSTRVWVTEPA